MVKKFPYNFIINGSLHLSIDLIRSMALKIHYNDVTIQNYTKAVDDLRRYKSQIKLHLIAVEKLKRWFHFKNRKTKQKNDIKNTSWNYLVQIAPKLNGKVSQFKSWIEIRNSKIIYNAKKMGVEAQMLQNGV